MAGPTSAAEADVLARGGPIQCYLTTNQFGEDRLGRAAPLAPARMVVVASQGMKLGLDTPLSIWQQDFVPRSALVARSGRSRESSC